MKNTLNFELIVLGDLTKAKFYEWNANEKKRILIACVS